MASMIVLRFETQTEPKQIYNVIIDEADFLTTAYLKMVVRRLDDMVGARLIGAEVC